MYCQQRIFLRAALAALLLATLCAVPPGEQAIAQGAPPPEPSAALVAAPPIGRWAPAGPLADVTQVNAVAMSGPALAENTAIVIGTENGAFRSADGGASWQEWSEGLTSRRVVALVHNGAGVFYALSNRLVFRRGRFEARWSAVSAGLPQNPGTIDLLASDGAGALFAADSDPRTATPFTGRVFSFDAATATWVDFTAGLPGATVGSSDIVALAAGVGTAYLSFEQELSAMYQYSYVYARPAGAAGWSNITGALPLTMPEPDGGSFFRNTAQVLALSPEGTLFAGLFGQDGGIWGYLKGSWRDLSDAGAITTVAGIDIANLAAASNGILATVANGNVLIGSYAENPATPGQFDVEWGQEGAVAGTSARAVVLSPEADGDRTLFIGTTSGLLRSLNLGQVLRAVNSGLGPSLSAQILAFAGDGTLFAVGPQRAYRLGDKSSSWTAIREQSYSALAPSANFSQDGTLIASEGIDNNYAFYLHRSADRGATWLNLSLTDAAPPDILRSSPNVLHDDTFFAALRGQVGASSFGMHNLLRFNVRDGSGSIINGALTGRQLNDLATAPDPASGPFPLAATDSGVWRFNGADWAPFNGGELSEAAAIRTLAYSPSFASDRALFAVGAGGLFQRDPGGSASWSQLPAQVLPLAAVTSLAVSPAFAADYTLFAGTETQGVWVSRDGGASWDAINKGLPTLETLALAVSPAFASDRTLVVSTAGTGIFRYTLPPPAPPWLVLLYLAGDDLGSQSLSEPLADLVGRLGSLHNRNVRVVALFDGNQEGDSQIFLREPGAEGLQLLAPPPTLPGREWDSGSVATFKNFVRWALDSYPGSRHTMLAIVDHGGGWAPDFGEPGQSESDLAFQAGGWRGLSIDASSGSSLSTRDTGAALDGLLDDGERFDIIFFDACLMGMIESLYEVQQHSDYLIAGQNLLWATLPYERYLAPDLLSATTTGRELAAGIVERYNAGATEEEPVVIAALDARRLGEIPPLIEALASSLNGLLDTPAISSTVQTAILTAYKRAQKFDYDVNLRIDQTTDGYVDLADMLGELAPLLETLAPTRESAAQLADIGQIAAAIRSIITERTADNRLVVAGPKVVSGRSPRAPEAWQFDSATGLSIYMPLGERDCRPTGPVSGTSNPRCGTSAGRELPLEDQLDYYERGEQLAFTRDTPSWPDLLRTLSERTELAPNTDFNSPAQIRTSWQIHLPILRASGPRPDLAVLGSIQLLPAAPRAGEPVELRVTIKNAGALDITRPFWVDLYVDPREQPRPNDIWTELSRYGVAWHVASLGAGETITLSSLQPDDPSDPGGRFSNFSRFVISGAHQLYVLVDSYSEGQATGAIAEADEVNNLLGPQSVTVVPVQLD
jgi:hypothetical protein